MITLLTMILFAWVIAFFATQNTSGVSITLANFTLHGVALYVIVLASVLTGILLSSVISLIGTVSSALTIRGKEQKIREYEKRVDELKKKIHELSHENVRLKREETHNGEGSRFGRLRRSFKQVL